MAVTTLDPRLALIVIDLQNGIVARAAADAIGPVVQNARALADAFRRHHLTVVLVTVTGVPPGRTEHPRFRDIPSDFAELIPEMSPQPGDHLVSKQTPGAFTRTDLESYLTSQGVTQVVVVGVATSIGVTSTARQAHELGLNVTLAVDAMTDLDPDLHAISVAKIFPRLSETGTTAEIIAHLDRRGD